MSAEIKHFTINNLFSVEGWVVLVTGGSSGIGVMIAQGFANNGARVYIVGRHADALQQVVDTWTPKLEHPKGQLIPLTADVSDKASIEQLAQQVASKEQKLDVLVNNAGVVLGTSTVEKGKESAEALRDVLWKEKQEDWETIFRTNVIGSVYVRSHYMSRSLRQYFVDASSCRSRFFRCCQRQTDRTIHPVSSIFLQSRV